MNYISLDQCKSGYLYRIFSRNLSFGVFIEKTAGFIGIRQKFGYEYLFVEYHRDLNNRCATVSPKEELCQSPFTEKDIFDDSKESEIFNWLKDKEKEYV
jgi:hypothetical protein